MDFSTDEQVAAFLRIDSADCISSDPDDSWGAEASA